VGTLGRVSGDRSMELTLAIPYYTGRHYLERAIRSVLAQRDSRWRLNVCDGRGAEPGLGAFVHSFQDARIRYFGPTGPLGMVENWNRCLDSAGTELVTLLHADDELLADYCGLMRDAAGRHPEATALFCRARIIDADGTERFSLPDYVKGWLVPGRGGRVVLRGEPGLRALLRGNFIMCPTLCYRSSRLHGRRFAPAWTFTPDLELVSRLLLDGETLLGLPAVGYAYRRHAQNTTTAFTDNLYRFKEEAQLYAFLRRATREAGWRRAAGVAAAGWMIKLNLGFCTLADLCRRRPGPALQKAALFLRLLRGGDGLSLREPRDGQQPAAGVRA
jgi:hypothetical protein